MTTDNIKDKLKEIELDTSDESNYYLYVLKLENKKINGQNKLTYKFFDSQMKKDVIKETIKSILDHTTKKILDNTETEFKEYKATNLKTVIDYIKLTDLDFSNTDITDEALDECKTDNYKVQRLLNAMYNSEQITKNVFKNFTGIRHTVLYCKTDNHKLIIINRGCPIYKPKNMMFLLDDTDKTLEYSQIKTQLFKIPFYPGIIIIDDICLFIADKIETLFGFSEQTKIIKNEILNKISESSIFDESQFSYINKFANKGKNYNYFTTYDKKRLNKIKNKDKKALKALKEVGLRFNAKNEPIIEDENDAEKVMAFICNILKKDVYDENSYCIAINNRTI